MTAKIQKYESKGSQPIEGGNAAASGPWGLTRMTERLPAAPAPYATFTLDPETQLTNFYDASGAVVDMSNRGTKTTYTSITMSRQGDGSANAPQVGDDDKSDNGTD
ncbi:putative ATP-grasp-modified RiPP [Streptosporangium subroseum]|uniref:putative ATP-grasp-modified RiPP n=1 Tax=Streptosporangium subroseum TaxID=106412 RepID=UPI003088F8CC|nr:putative ATP-grasp-modified RiPP [Streptosporangium subroseum]